MSRTGYFVYHNMNEGESRTIVEYNKLNYTNAKMLKQIKITYKKGKDISMKAMLWGVTNKNVNFKLGDNQPTDLKKRSHMFWDFHKVTMDTKKRVRIMNDLHKEEDDYEAYESM